MSTPSIFRARTVKDVQNIRANPAAPPTVDRDFSRRSAALPVMCSELRATPPLHEHPLVKHYGLPLEHLALTKAHRAVEGEVVDIVPGRRHQRGHGADDAQRMGVEAGQDRAAADQQHKADQFEQQGVADAVKGRAHGDRFLGGPSRALPMKGKVVLRHPI